MVLKTVTAFLPRHLVTGVSRQSLHQGAIPSTLFQDGTADAVNKFSSVSLADDFDAVNPLFPMLQSVAIGVGGLVAVLLLISVIFATFIVPAAAKEVEEQVKEKYPDLWAEYQRKLEPGETFAQRPDLLSEIGSKLEELQMQEFDEAAAQVMEQQQQEQQQSKPSAATITDATIVDVEVISKEEDKQET